MKTFVLVLTDIKFIFKLFFNKTLGQMHHHSDKLSLLTFFNKGLFLHEFLYENVFKSIH